ncbi:MAG: UTP--glucose-1-phosphate uridylyltransferase [Nitrospinaceae bacterium]
MKKALNELNLSPSAVEGFLRLYEKYKQGPAKIADWESVRSPDPTALLRYESLTEPDEDVFRVQLKRLAVCKLNGGLGTSMGCEGPKSSIIVRGGKTFLDLIVEQLDELQSRFQGSVPLVLMNSFYTHEATVKFIQKYPGGPGIRVFQQNKFPRLIEGSESFLAQDDPGPKAWYPPGHGDFYDCIRGNGLLDDLLEEGREILFISNVDNLGAVVDSRILNHMLERDIPFLIEMTEKTPADVKGGTMYQEDGKLKLLEIARVPDEHVDEFCGLRKFRVFNTNNIWINLAHLRKKLEEGPLDLDVIVNRKTVDGQNVIQLETAIGSALECFPGAAGLTVSRGRFLPVKKTDDLLLVQSDLFNLEKGRLVRNPQRTLPGLPVVRFGKTFEGLEDYRKRIPQIPRILELKSLDLEGDVRFEGQATLKGEVRLAGREKSLTIPKDAVLEDQVIEQ